MTFKEKALKALRECPLAVDAGEAYNRRELIAAVEKIPEEDERCAGPNYEGMCKELEAKLLQTKQELEACTEVNRYLRTENERLAGFREAVLWIFPEEKYCHGLH